MILKGNDALEKANKMMESLNVSQKVDSFSNVEKIFSAYNGKHYGIVKERTKYIIKEAVVKNAKNPSDFEYIDGVQNKSRYSKNTLLEAERTLNLWNIEFSRIYGTSLMKEQDEMPEDEEPAKKTVLKVPVKKSAAPAMDMPPMPAGDAMGADMPPMPAGDAAMGADMPAEGGDMPPMADAEGAEGVEGMPEEDEEDGESGVDPKKSIQKLAGKLAYELREFEGEDEDYSDIYKFAASMVASAADANKITEKDKKAIIKKVEKNLISDEEDEIAADEDEMPADEMPADEMPEASEEAPEGIDKTLAEAFRKIKEAKNKMSAKQEKFLDKDKDGELTKKDFEMLGNSKNQGKNSSVTLMKGKNSKKGKKSLKEGSGYSSSMGEEYMMSEEDDFTFEMGGKKNKDGLLLGGQYMSEYGLDEEYMSEYGLDEEYMSEVAAMGEKGYSLYEEDESILDITDLDEDVYFEMNCSQKKK